MKDDTLAVPSNVLPLPLEPQFALEPVKTLLSGFYKTLSMFYLRAADLPILDGVVVLRWTSEAEQEVLPFFRRRKWQEVLLRHDKKDETPRAPRGGYLVPLNELRLELERYFQDNRIVILLEPRSPYEDLYSINTLFEGTSDTVLVEVVGPGFDASDLNRGDISPHERLRVNRQLLERFGHEDVWRAVTSRDVIAPDEYRKSVALRLAKIGERHTGEKCAGKGREHLEREGHCLLLTHGDHYELIPEAYLVELFGYLKILPNRLSCISDEGNNFVVSASFLSPDRRLVFWDIVWPHLKYGSINQRRF